MEEPQRLLLLFEAVLRCGGASVLARSTRLNALRQELLATRHNQVLRI